MGKRWEWVEQVVKFTSLAYDLGLKAFTNCNANRSEADAAAGKLNLFLKQLPPLEQVGANTLKSY